MSEWGRGEKKDNHPTEAMRRTKHLHHSSTSTISPSFGIKPRGRLDEDESVLVMVMTESTLTSYRCTNGCSYHSECSQKDKKCFTVTIMQRQSQLLKNGLKTTTTTNKPIIAYPALWAAGVIWGQSQLTWGEVRLRAWAVQKRSQSNLQTICRCQSAGLWPMGGSLTQSGRLKCL